MKDLFPGHFRAPKAALTTAWRTSLIVFDANILLNLYRYSDSTRKEFLKLIRRVSNQLWLPHRAAEEYLTNRLVVVEQQERAYDDTIKAVNGLRVTLENTRQHPFVGRDTMSRISEVFDQLCKELSENKQAHTSRIVDDDIRDAVAELFSKRVGPPFGTTELESLLQEGEERFKNKVPPGFKDSGKAAENESLQERVRRFGDLVVWKQVLDKAREAKKGVILVTDDRKEDWWEIFKGRTVGPRPELVAEFVQQTQQSFHMYQADRFLELAREMLDAEVSEHIVEEVRETRRRKVLEEARRKSRAQASRERALKEVLAEVAHARAELEMMEADRHKLAQQFVLLQESRRSHQLMSDADAREFGGAEFEHVMANRQAALDAEYYRAAKAVEMAAVRLRDVQSHLAILEGQAAELRALADE